MGEFEKIFGRSAQLIVLEYLLMNRNRISYLSGIAEATGLSHSSVTRVIEPLLKADIVKEDAIGKQMRTFVLDMDNERTKLLIRFFDDLDKILPGSRKDFSAPPLLTRFFDDLEKISCG